MSDDDKVDDQLYGAVTAIKAYPPPGAAMQRYPRLRWRDRRGEQAFLLERRAMIGSAPSADIQIGDPAVSRIHAELDPKEDGVWIRDLGSRNGTFVSGVLVREARMTAGLRIQIGSTEISFDVVDRPAEAPWPIDSFGPLRGGSRPMRELFKYLSTIAPTEASVLIRGETGTGKELVARAIHDASARRRQPFIVVDCGAVPENLMVSELFGSERGAFTGADASRDGAIAAADGGTVFFDEIGELPLAMQPKLLRVLETREVRKLGATTSRKVDVRFLAASHRDLRQMVNAGAFREDLYFRLAVIPVTIPSLRERVEDIPMLVRHFLPAGAPSPDAELIRMLQSRPWLGNVRELRNFVSRSTAIGIEAALAISDSPPPSRTTTGPDATSIAPRSGDVVDNAATSDTDVNGEKIAVKLSTVQPFKAFREAWMEAGEREYVFRLLERHQRHVATAADAAGLDRTYLYRLIRKHVR